MNEELSITSNLDISIWGLILQADLVVRIVMLILLFLSIFSWSIIFEKLTSFEVKRKIIKKPRVGDHIWYITNMKRFKNDYPNWKQNYNTQKIIEELINN